MFLLLTSLASAQALGPTRVHVGVQLSTNDPFVRTQMAVGQLTRELRFIVPGRWLEVEAGAAMDPVPPRANQKALTHRLWEDTFAPDLSYLRFMGWTGLRASPLRNHWGRLSAQAGVHLGAGAVHSLEPWWHADVGRANELSLLARYGAQGELSLGRWGANLQLSSTHHEESFAQRGGGDATVMRNTTWVYGGLSCRL